MDYYGNDNNGSGGFQNDPFSPGNDPSFSGGWDNGPSMNGEDPNHHNKNKRSRKPMSPEQKGAIKIVALCLVWWHTGGLAQPIYSSVTRRWINSLPATGRPPRWTRPLWIPRKS